MDKKHAHFSSKLFISIDFDALSYWQVDKEEVRLRRTVGLKKDEYFLDGKHITWVSDNPS